MTRQLPSMLRALLALLLGIALATGTSAYLQQQAQAEAQRIFDERAEHITQQLQHKHQDLVQHLQSLGTLLRLSPQLTTEQFRQLLASIGLQHEHPGIIEVLYLTPPAGDAQLNQGRVRVALTDTVSQKPDSPNTAWAPPAELLSLLRQTRDQGSTLISLPFAPNRAGWPHPTLLLATPVYLTPVVPPTEAERRARLQGWAVVAIDPNTAFLDLGRSTHADIDFDAYLGPTHQAVLLHDRDAANHPQQAASTELFDPARYDKRPFRRLELLSLSGQELHLLISANQPFNPSRTLATSAVFILVIGLLVSVLTAWVLWRTTAERIRSQQQARSLADQLEVMATVARATRNGVLITDAEQRITWVNDGFTRLSGYTADEAIGRCPAELLASPNMPQDKQVVIDQAIRGRRDFEIEIVNRRKDGQDYWLRLEIRPYFNRSGVFQGFIEIETDIDEERRNNELMRAALNENAALMHALNHYALVSETDAEGRLTRINERCAEFSSYTPSELLGQKLDVLAPEQEMGIPWQKVWETVRQRQTWRQEIASNRADGTPFWLDIIIVPIFQGNSQLEKLVSISFDITERKLADSTLRDNREMFARMGEIAGIGYWYDLVGANRIEMSEQALKIIEADPEHPPTAKEVYERYSPESEFVLNMAVKEAAELAEPFDLELQFTTFRHHKKWLRLAAKPEFRDGKMWRLVGAVQDITERVETQRRIVENDRILRSAIDAIGEAFVLYDPQDRLVFCNEKYRDLYDLSSDLIVPGARFEDIVRIGAQRGQYPQAIGREEEWVAERLAIHYSEESSSEQQLSGGRWVRLAECRTQDGYHVGFRIDITDFKRAVQQAEEASNSKSRFLANMSHEIRTPMNAILGMLQLLQNTHLTTSQADYVSKTQGAAKSLLGILNDILDFSKVEAGKMQLDPEPNVFDDVMRELGVIMASNLGAKKLELLFDIDPSLPRVLVFDALRLKQILINLAGNAIKFTAQGEVLVRVNLVKCEDQVVWLEFAVKDTGIGISPENQQRIFEGFSQAETSTSRRFGGTGLGLAICRRLVALMGGELVLDSSLGAGSTFHFMVPMPLADSESAPADKPPRTEPRSVLLLESNTLARAIHARQLRALGFFVDSADQGELALSLAHSRHERQQHYDALLLDAELPNQDCASLVQTLRNIWPDGSTPPRVVAIGGQAPPAANAAPSTTWWDAWLVKPATTLMLQEALQPSQTSSHLASPPASAGRSAELQGLQVLLVEDNPINQQVAQELLQSRGAQVHLAGNGQEALNRLQAPQHGIDIVLMDMQMPVMDGLEATRAIRQRLGLTDLPIVAMTANAMQSDREQCIAAGMNDHIGKPFDLNQLVDVLLRWTQRDGNAFRQATPAAEHSVLPAHPATPMFDPHSAIERFGGDLVFYRKLLEQFLTEAPTLFTRVQQHWGHSASDTAASSHSLKGSAATLGLQGLAQAAAQVELHTKSQTLATPTWPSALLQQLEQALQQSLLDSQAWLNERAPLTTGSTASTQLDNVQLANSLRQLATLLNASDMESLEVFDELTSKPEAQQLPHWATLTEAMNVLDFERACTTVENILQHLPQ